MPRYLSTIVHASISNYGMRVKRGNTTKTPHTFVFYLHESLDQYDLNETLWIRAALVQMNTFAII